MTSAYLECEVLYALCKRCHATHSRANEDATMLRVHHMILRYVLLF